MVTLILKYTLFPIVLGWIFEGLCCYVTVGMFAWLGLGSLSKYTEWSVLGSVLSTKSEEDLDSIWWWVVNLQRNKSLIWRITLSGFRCEGMGIFWVYWLLPEYSSTMKEVKSEATGCQQTDLYTLRNNRVTVLRMSLVHIDVTEDNRKISNAWQGTSHAEL